MNNRADEPFFKLFTELGEINGVVVFLAEVAEVHVLCKLLNAEFRFVAAATISASAFVDWPHHSKQLPTVVNNHIFRRHCLLLPGIEQRKLSHDQSFVWRHFIALFDGFNTFARRAWEQLDYI